MAYTRATFDLRELLEELQALRAAVEETHQELLRRCWRTWSGRITSRAECVMLNKGPYLFHALDILDSVVSRMQHHQMKKTAQFRALHW